MGSSFLRQTHGLVPNVEQTMGRRSEACGELGSDCGEVSMPLNWQRKPEGQSFFRKMCKRINSKPPGFFVGFALMCKTSGFAGSFGWFFIGAGARNIWVPCACERLTHRRVEISWCDGGVVGNLSKKSQNKKQTPKKCKTLKETKSHN